MSVPSITGLALKGFLPDSVVVMPLAAMQDGSQDNQGEEGGGGEGGKEEERKDARPSFPSFSREMKCQDPSTGCYSIRGQECHSLLNQRDGDSKFL